MSINRSLIEAFASASEVFAAAEDALLESILGVWRKIRHPGCEYERMESRHNGLCIIARDHDGDTCEYLLTWEDIDDEDPAESYINRKKAEAAAAEKARAEFSDAERRAKLVSSLKAMSPEARAELLGSID